MYKVIYEVNMFPLIPYFSNCSTSPCLHTMSNAFSRSTNMARTFFVLLVKCVTYCIWSVVECCFLKQLCVLATNFSLIR